MMGHLLALGSRSPEGNPWKEPVELKSFREHQEVCLPKVRSLDPEVCNLGLGVRHTLVDAAFMVLWP